MSGSEVFETSGGERFYERAGVLVPSSVVRTDLEQSSAGFLALVQEMNEHPSGVEINTTTWRVYLCLAALQLSSMHPDLPARLQAEMTTIGRAMQQLLVEVYSDQFDDLEELLEAGWHRDLNVTRERQR